MCTTCGCSDDAGTRVTTLHSHEHGLDHAPGRHRDHSHAGGHEHQHTQHHPAAAEPQPSPRTVTIEQQVLAKNDSLADGNRDWLAARGIRALNMMSSPGSGKTSLLVRTIRDLGDERTIAVIEGDQETLLDAERIRATGCGVVQINTGAGCHLDAQMLLQGITALDPPDRALLFIENVGNLVCPALFDLGEQAKVVVISVTEGDDKPLKYPHMFAAADLVLVNKVDLLPYVDFDVDACSTHARSVNPRLEILPISATTGLGLDDWYDWLRRL